MGTVILFSANFLYVLLTIATPKTGAAIFIPLVFPIHYLALKLHRQSLTMTMRPAKSALLEDPRAPVLYLRSFGRDRVGCYTWLQILFELFRPKLLVGGLSKAHLSTYEEMIVEELYKVGPVVAVSDPKDSGKLPPIGAHRIDFDHDNWQDGVIAIADSAAVIVLILDTTPGAIWELLVSVKSDRRRKLLLLTPHLRTRREEDRYRTAYSKLKSVLPELPDFSLEIVAIRFNEQTNVFDPVFADSQRRNPERRCRLIKDLMLTHYLGKLSRGEALPIRSVVE